MTPTGEPATPTREPATPTREPATPTGEPTAATAGRATLPLSGCSFGWLHLAPLPDALRALARQGFRSLELTTAPPHLSADAIGPYERRELARLLATLQLRVVSVNPSFTDLNLVSTNPEIREVSERQLIANIELAADLGANAVVGVSYDTGPMVGAAEVLCYGTAVIVEPVVEHRP